MVNIYTCNLESGKNPGEHKKENYSSGIRWAVFPFILFLALILDVRQGWGQNFLNSGDFVGGTWGTGQAMSASAGGSLIITKTVATSGDKYFRFFGDGSPCGEYQPTTNGDFFTHNVAVTVPNGNCGSSNAWRVNVPSTTSNVVFKTDGGNDGIDRSIVYVIQGAVQSVGSVAQSPTSANVFPGLAVTVTATLSGAFATGQAAYLRYTTDGYSTSTVVTMTGSGTSYTASIPASANTPGASLSYYVFTSGNTAPASNGSDADFATINLNNNGGSNYSYTVASGWTTTATGAWTAPGTWTANAVPPTTNSMGTVTINHNVTSFTADAVCSSISIGAAGTLTASSNTLTINNGTSGTTFSRNATGTYTASGTHTVVFSGAATHTVSGTVVFNNVNTSTGVNFGASSTVNGVLTLNAGGFVSTNAPTYGGASTLTYNTGGVYAAGTEWTANALTGQGVPFNVTISTASTSVNFAASTQYRRLRGSLTISASTFLALSTASGGDLRIGGNWTNNGTFTANGRAVIFDGSALQTINATATGFAYLFISNTTANVTAAAAITVANALTIDAGARLDVAANTLTITGSTSSVNGSLRSAGTITGASTTTLTFSSTGVYEHNYTTTSGVIPTATWSVGSTCRIIGFTTFSGPMTSTNGWGQSFHHFEWACAGQTSTCNWQMNATTPPTILGNFTVSNSNTAAAGLRLASSGTYTLNISGNLSVSAASALNTARLDLSNGSAGIINLSGNLTVNNVGTNLLSVGGGGSGVINFSGSSAQSATVPTSGNITGGVSFRLNNAAGLSIPTGSTLPINAAATFFRTNGSVTLAGTGVIAYSATNTTLNYDGTGAITTQDAEFPSASGPANLTINNAGGVTLHATRTLTGTAGVLTLTNGRLSLGSNNLTVPNTASAAIAGTFSASTMVVADGSGRLLRGIATAALPITYTWPVGETTGTTEYSPVSLTFSANSTARSIGFNVVDGNHPQLNSPDVQTNYISRYWTSSNSAAGTYSYTGTFTYVAADVNGSEGSMYVNLWNGSAWAQPISAAASNVLTISSAVTETTLPLGATAEFTGRVRPASTYAWVATTGSADWQAAASWSPSRTVLGPDDILTFPNGGSSTATNVPSQTIGKLVMSNNTSITLVPSASNNTLTLTGGTGTDIDIASGCSMTVGQAAGNSLSLTFSGTGHVVSIAGTYSIPQNATNVHDYNTTNATTTVTGTFNMGGTVTGATTTTLTFGAGSFYIHTRNGGSVPTATWNSTSTLSVTGVTTTVPSSPSLAQSIGNWVWNCSGQSAEVAILNTNMPSAIAGSWTISGTNGQILAFSAVSKNYSTANWTITGNSSVYLLRSGSTTTDITVNNLDLSTNTSSVGLHLNTGTGTSALRVSGNMTINSSSTTALNWGNTSGNIAQIYVTGNFTLTAGILTAGTTAINRLRFANAGVKNYSCASTVALTEVIVEAGTLDLGASGMAITAPITVNNGATIKLGSGNVVSSVGNVALSASGNIEFASTGILSNTGTFSISAGTFTTVNPNGIATTGASGCVQSTSTRTFSTSASYVFNGSAAQITGTGFTGGANLTINNSSGVTLSATVTTITSTLALTSGKLSLSSFDLTLPSTATITGASSSNYVATTGTGRLRRSALTTSFTFPVGNSTYNPITITNSGTSDTYGVIVADGSVPAATETSACVDRRWIITEGTAGGGNLSVTAQYNSGETGGTYTTASQVYVGLYIPTTWTTAATTVNGTNPFTAAASGFNQSLPTTGTTAYFAIGNEAMSLAAPTISTTVSATAITNNSTSTGGQGITGSSLTAKGVVYSTAAVSTSPTLSNSVLADGGTTTSNFTSNLTGLDPETQFYVRAYATNPAGTGYGPAINFRTLSNPATVQATSLSGTPTASGTLTLSWTGASFPASGATQGGYALIYSTGTPTLSSANGAAPAAGVGTLVTITPGNLPTAPATTYVLSGLTGGTVYNFLLVPFTWDGTNAATYNYLTTSAPTASATAVSTASVTTTAVSAITSSSAASGGSAINSGGGTVSAKGLVWNTSTAPTTANSSTNDGTGTASFSSSLNSLSAQTLYYYRAYVTNDIGTVYGNEASFYTLSNEPTAAATSFTATANGSSQIDLSWTAATFPGTGATNSGYIILRRVDSTDPSTSGVVDGVNPASLSLPSGTTLVTTITSGTTASFNHTGLLASTQYNYIIVPFTWDGTNSSTYNYYPTSAPTANAATDAGLPSVDVTSAASSITNNSASTGGSSLVAGGSAITAKGVAYNTTGSPTISDNTTNNGSGTADFTSSLTGLNGQTVYYVRAYVTNTAGTAYGNEINFRTLSNPATVQASGLTATASASGELTINWTAATFPSSGATQGGYALIYSTGTPTLSSTNATAPAAGTGTLVTITPANLPTAPATSYVLTGLTAGTTYNFLLVPFTWNGTNANTYNYLTASAPTAAGTAVSPASVTSTAISSVTASSANSGGSSITAGGGTISAKGLVWNTSTAPTTANSSTNDGTGSTSYSSSLTSLSAQTLYYARAYVTNEIGTVYGNELTFRTLSNAATVQAGSLSGTPTADGTLTINWTGATFPASGATQGGYALIYSTGTPTLSSANGAAPAAGVGTFVTITPTNLPSTPSTSYVLSGLTGGTTYNFLLVPFTWDGTNATSYNYLTTSAPTASATAVATASLSTTAASAITNTAASSGGSAVNAGGGTISAKGLVWNTATAPTTANSSTNDGTGTSSFSSSLASLSPQTLYYARAYATNNIGTVYGNEITFRTLSNPPTAQASGLSATASSSSSINLSWSAATFPVSGATTTGYVLLRATSPNTPSLGNVNGAAPTAGANTTIVNSALTGTSGSSSGLSAATSYNYLLVPYTWDGVNATTYNYLTALAPTASATTYSALPSAQPTALVFSSVTSSAITSSWTAATGSPSGYIVLRSSGSAPNTDPSAGITYTAGNTLGNATVVFVGSAVTTGAQTGLADGTTYFYEVFSYNGSGGTINYLTTSPLAGSQATTNVAAPVATAATSAAATSFTANWGAVSGATGYLLDVSTNPCFATFGSSSTATEGFSGGITAPSGWTFTAIDATYTTPTNFGAASPSLSLNATGDRVLTNQLSGAAASELSFWIKGQGTNTLSALLVEGTTDGTNWVTIENITASIPTTGTTKTYNFSSTPLLPCGMIQFRFTYTKNAGNLAFDDVSITSASSTADFVSGYNNLSVSGTSSSVSGLTSSTTYYYRLRAVGTNSTSTNSNVITAATLNDPATADYRSVASGNYTSAATWEYNSIGSTWVAATQAPTSASNVTIQAAHTVTLDASQSINSGKTLTISGTLDAGANNLSGSGIVAMGATSTIITSSASGLAGVLQVAAPASCTFAAGAKFHFTGTAVNTGFASFTGVGSFTFYNIVWAGSTSLTLDKSIRITNLDFNNNGLIYLGNFDLFVSSSGNINGTSLSASKMIVTDGTGSLFKFIPTSAWTSFTWPIGEVTGTAEYSPVTIASLTGNAAASAYIGFRVTDAVDPNNGLASNYITRYWTYTTANLTAGSAWSNATFAYTAADVVGTEASLKANVYNSASSAWTEFSTSSAASNTLSFTSGASTTTVLTGNTITGRVDPPLYYRSASSGNWGTAATWLVSTDPTFTSPAGIAAVSAPTASNSIGITIMSGHAVTSAASVSADQLTIQSTGSLEMTNNALTISNGTGTDVTVNSGATLFLSGTSTITINTGATMQVDGLYKVSSTAAPVVTSTGTTTISSSGTYEHARDAGNIPACTWSTGSTCLISGTGNNAPTGLGQSFHHFTVNTTLTNSVNCSGDLQTINGKFKLTTNHASFGWRLTGTTNYTLNVADSLIITNGILDVGSGGAIGTVNANGPLVMNGSSSQFTKTGAATMTINSNGNLMQNAGIIEFNAGGSSNTTWNIKGDFVQGGTVQRTNGGTHILNFNKTSGTQTWTQSTAFGTGAITINIGNSTTNTVQLLSNVGLGSSAQAFNVNNGATLNMGPWVLSGTSSVFTLGATGALKLGNANGIVTAPTASGNVQTLTRNFPATASYFYNGTANQVTGNALPATLTGTGNLNIESSAGIVVSLSANTTVPTLNLISGLFAAGLGQNLTLSNNGLINDIGGDFVTGPDAGTVVASGSAVFNGTSNPYNVYTSGGINFGAQTVTIQNGGTFRINSGGFVNTNAPFYAAGSTLEYNTGGNYGRGPEWSSSSGRGYPHHVTVRNNTNHQPGANGNTGTVLRMGGDLNIHSGSGMYLDWGFLETTVDFRVAGNIVLDGSLSLSTVSGDLYVGGNWSRTGTFEPRGREVVLNGSAAQTFTGPTGFDYFRIINTSSGLTLNSGLFINQRLQIDDGQIILGSNDITLSGAAVITGGNASDYLVTNGTGAVIQNVSGGNDWYPVGPSTTIFGPVTLNQTGTADNISVRVSTAPAYTNAVNDNSKMVNLEWTINEGTAGGNNISSTFGWTTASEGASFDRTAGVYQGNHNGTRYVVRATEPTSGSNPYYSLSTTSQRYTGNLSSQRFVVGNIGGILPCLQTTTAGAWNSAGSWLDGVVPPEGSNVCIRHAMSLSSSVPNPDGVTFETNGSLSISNGTTLTLGSPGTITNSSGSFVNMTSGSIAFSGLGVINGSNAIGFNNLELNGNTTLTTTPTINGTLEIKPGGFILSSTGPNYAASSTLRYNTGGSYNRSNEWNASSGSGYPASVQISGNTSLDISTGAAGIRQIAGSMTINAGSSLTQGNSNQGLIVPGNFTLNGTYSMSSVAGGDLVVSGNWSSGASASLTHNNRDVRFDGTGAQTISVANGLQFGFLTIDNSGSGVSLLNPVTVNTFRVNANRTFSLSTNKIIISAGGNLLNNGTFDANTGTIEYTNGGSFTNNGTFDRGTSTIDFVGSNAGVVTGTVQTNFHNIRLFPGGGIDFGSGALRGKVSGTLQLRAGSYVANNSPIYEAGAKLMYSGGGTFNRNVEWDPNTVQKVEVTNNTTLVGAANSGQTGFSHVMADSLIIRSGSSFTLANGNNMTSPLRVGGHLLNEGTLTLSGSVGGDLEVGGDLVNNGTFNANDRMVSFTGSSDAGIKGVNTIFHYMTVDKSAGKTLTATVPFSIGTLSSGSQLRVAGGTFDLNNQAITFLPGNHTLRIDGGFAKAQTLKTGGTNITGFASFSSNGSNSDTLGGKLNYSGSGEETLLTPVKGYQLLWITGASTKNIPQNTLVRDSLLIASGSTLSFGSINSTLELGGNLVNDGSASGSAGKILMKNTSARSLSGSGTIHNLEVDNAAGIAVSGKPVINSSLTLTNGKMMTAADTILLGSSASISETYNTGSYVLGNLKTVRTVNTNASNFGGMGIELSSGDNLGVVTAIRTSGDSGLISSLPVLGLDSSIRWNWTISPSVQPASEAPNRSLTLYWPATEDNNRNISSLQIWKRSTTEDPWEEAGALQTAGGTSVLRSVVWNDVNGFSQFTVGENDVPLALDLLSFTAVKERQNARIEWKTADDSRVLKYELEKSVDMAKTFSVLEVRQADQKDGQYLAYDYRFHSDSYYRIKAFYADGKTDVSRPVFLKVNPGITSFFVYPNPVSSGQGLQIQRTTGLEGLHHAVVYSSEGKQLIQISGEFSSLNTELKGQTSDLPKGVYLLRLEAGNSVESMRFIIE